MLRLTQTQKHAYTLNTRLRPDGHATYAWNKVRHTSGHVSRRIIQAPAGMQAGCVGLSAESETAAIEASRVPITAGTLLAPEQAHELRLREICMMQLHRL